MDIHKPGPIQNWRDLLKEVGVIVLGVSIALGAEQAVEWLHWRSEVTAARAAATIFCGPSSTGMTTNSTLPVSAAGSSSRFHSTRCDRSS